MVIFHLKNIEVPISIQSHTISYQRTAYSQLSPALQTVFDSVFAVMAADEPIQEGYQPDFAVFWFAYIKSRYDVVLLEQVAPAYVEDRVY